VLLELHRVWDGSTMRFMSPSHTFSSSSVLSTTNHRDRALLPHMAHLDLRASIRLSDIRWTFYLSTEHCVCDACVTNLCLMSLLISQLVDLLGVGSVAVLIWVQYVIFTSSNPANILPSCTKWNYRIFIHFGNRPDLGLGAG